MAVLVEINNLEKNIENNSASMALRMCKMEGPLQTTFGQKKLIATFFVYLNQIHICEKVLIRQNKFAE